MKNNVLHKKTLLYSMAVATVLLACSTSFALSRSPWEMHDGLEVTDSNPNGWVEFTCTPSKCYFPNFCHTFCQINGHKKAITLWWFAELKWSFGEISGASIVNFAVA